MKRRKPELPRYHSNWQISARFLPSAPGREWGLSGNGEDTRLSLNEKSPQERYSRASDVSLRLRCLAPTGSSLERRKATFSLSTYLFCICWTKNTGARRICQEKISLRREKVKDGFLQRNKKRGELCENVGKSALLLGEITGFDGMAGQVSADYPKSGDFPTFVLRFEKRMSIMQTRKQQTRFAYGSLGESAAMAAEDTMLTTMNLVNILLPYIILVLVLVVLVRNENSVFGHAIG